MIPGCLAGTSSPPRSSCAAGSSNRSTPPISNCCTREAESSPSATPTTTEHRRMNMRIGVTLPSRKGPIGDVGDKARRAEEAGFQSVWSYEVYRNPFTLLSVAAANTESVTLGTGLAAAFSRSPFEAANAAADIDDMSDGRMLFGLGTGVPEFLRA